MALPSDNDHHIPSEEMHNLHLPFHLNAKPDLHGDLPLDLPLDLDEYQSQASNYPACYLASNPIDIYRISIAKTLSEIVSIKNADNDGDDNDGDDEDDEDDEDEKGDLVSAREIYPLIQRSATLATGDLVLPVPALLSKLNSRSNSKFKSESKSKIERDGDGEKAEDLARRWVALVYLFSFS